MELSRNFYSIILASLSGLSKSSCPVVLYRPMKIKLTSKAYAQRDTHRRQV